MGWGSGSELLRIVWSSVRQEIPEKYRVKVLAKVIDAFENHDCDTTDEILEEFPEAKAALKKCGHEFDEEE